MLFTLINDLDLGELAADNAAELAAWEALTPTERAAVTATLEAARSARDEGDDDLPF